MSQFTVASFFSIYLYVSNPCSLLFVTLFIYMWEILVHFYLCHPLFICEQLRIKDTSFNSQLLLFCTYLIRYPHPAFYLANEDGSTEQYGFLYRFLPWYQMTLVLITGVNLILLSQNRKTMTKVTVVVSCGCMFTY